MGEEDLCETGKLIDFLLNGNMPFTTVQISRKLNVKQTDVIAVLKQLAEKGYVHMAPLTPNMDIVAPRVSLIDMTQEEKNELCKGIKHCDCAE